MAVFRKPLSTSYSEECLRRQYKNTARGYDLVTRGRQRFFSLCLLISTLVFLTQPAYAISNQKIPPSFEAVLNDSLHAPSTQTNSQLSPLRQIALKEAALSYGARSALARRTYEMAQILNQNQPLLDTIYNFAALLLANNVMPPVLSTARSTLKQSDANTLRVADAVYQIERQAQFVTTPKHWRDYLMHDFRSPVTPPTPLLLPKNKVETDLWQHSLAEGWELGKQQAEQIFQQSLARLERDYTGMILYRSLLAQRMISAPYVAEANLGVTGSRDGKVMQLNDRVLRITAKPAFAFHAASWQPRAIVKEELNKPEGM